MENQFTQLCVWPATIIGQENADEFETFFKDEFNVRVKYLTEVKTLPDLDKNGNAEPDTGGRNDAFFYVHSEDIGGFAVKRLQMGIRWWEDVIKYNDNSHLYNEEFINQYPPTW
jgi:hypothetical protein